MFKINSRTMVGGLAALIVLGTILGGTAYAGSAVKKNSLIDEATAEDFAILDANVQEEDIHDLNTSLEHDDGQYVYDIKFYVGNTEYDYEIRAEDGAILEKGIDYNDDEAVSMAPQSTDQTDQQTDSVKTQDISDTAETETPSGSAETAAQSANTDLQTTETQNQPETKTEKSANTKIQGNYISVDQAKQIALDHAGLTADQVHFSSAKLDNDDGTVEYEIEFYMGNLEYEYDIDAVTGEILESSSEYDDD